MKRIIAFILLTVTVLSAFSFLSIPVFAGDNNATGGDGDTHPAAQGYGWYNSSQYLYKVTLYVGKSESASKQSSLTDGFYCVGTVILKKTGWEVKSKTVFGDKTKVEYYSGASMTRMQNPYIISDSGCPKIPIACDGDIDEVKAYFGSTGTMNTLLNAIASQNGTTPYGLLKNKTFTIDGRTKSGWSEEQLLPNGTTNRVPWVIIYEPMVVMHLKDKTSLVAFTSTEFAISQENGWYDWHKSGGKGQWVDNLTEKHLPSSIQLEESWFGYPVFPIRSDSYKWPYEEIVQGGGWGMRWLGANAGNGIDLSVEFVDYDPNPVVETRVHHKIKWCNNKSTEQSVLCEIYSGTYLVTSYTLTIPGNSYILKDTVLTYHSTKTHRMIARINYDNRESETNPNNNSATVSVTPKSAAVPAIDYGCYFGGVETPEPNNYGLVEVTWKNYKDDAGTVLCELYREDTLIWSQSMYLEGREAVKETYSVYYPGASTQTLVALINYANRNSETDPNDNYADTVVTPVSRVDTTYDLSVSDVTVTPSSVYEGNAVRITFRSDNWNQDLSYEDILVELLIDGEVVETEYVDFAPYGGNTHSYLVSLYGAGTKTVAARINWEHRYEEDNSTNNYASTTAEVTSYYEFSIGNLSVTPSVASINGEVTVSFRTETWDEVNSYQNIPVQILYNGRVVFTSYQNYTPYTVRQHSYTLNVGDTVGPNQIYARINWQDHLNEANPNNNMTDTLVVTVNDTADLWIESVNPNADYRAGTQVVTSYIMHNGSSKDVRPSDNNTVFFEAYYYDGETKVGIDSQTWQKAVIPAKDENLVYFKWTVPDDIAGKTIYAEATVNASCTISEETFSNNTGRVVRTVASRLYSSTPDTRYEREKPSGFSAPSAPYTFSNQKTWSLWVYESGSFVKKNYGVQISAFTPTITPDQNSPSSVKGSDGIWTMKSGYGVTISYYPMASSVGGYTMAPSTAYTWIQTAYATFPEYKYQTIEGRYRTLEKVGSTFQFEENPNADHDGRVHFTPLWYPDGIYRIAVTALDFWTPAGMATARGSGYVKISGSAYGDWFLG